MVTALQNEKTVRDAFNGLVGTSAKKEILRFGKGAPSHEFDIFEKKKVIGGISTSPWFNKPKGSKRRTGNTAGQDRAATELLWLSLWQGPERRVHILTDKEMTKRLFKKFTGACFQKNVEIHHFDLESKKFRHVGTL
ncbi:MAG: hypothetical protein ACRETA_05245 [Gammaproteobacteria bacterium]